VIVSGAGPSAGCLAACSEAVEGGVAGFITRLRSRTKPRRVLRDKFRLGMKIGCSVTCRCLWGLGERITSASPGERGEGGSGRQSHSRMRARCRSGGDCSGDGHLLRLTAYEGIAILNATRLLGHSALSRSSTVPIADAPAPVGMTECFERCLGGLKPLFILMGLYRSAEALAPPKGRVDGL